MFGKAIATLFDCSVTLGLNPRDAFQQAVYEGDFVFWLGRHAWWVCRIIKIGPLIGFH